MFQLALLVIFAETGDGADLVEAAGIDDAVDALADSQAALVVLTLDLVRPAHLPREGFAPGQFLELRLPTHSFPLPR